jgi:hypothetical protein
MATEGLLDYSRQGLDATTAAQVLHDLRTDAVTTKIDLSYNPKIFESQSNTELSTITELCAVLAENTQLTVLDVSSTNIGPVEAQQLATALRNNTSIISLGIKNSKSAAPVLQALLMR